MIRSPGGHTTSTLRSKSEKESSFGVVVEVISRDCDDYLVLIAEYELWKLEGILNAFRDVEEKWDSPASPIHAVI